MCSWLPPASSSGRPARFRWPRHGSLAARPPVDADMARAGSRPSSAYDPASSLPLPSAAAAAELHAANTDRRHRHGMKGRGRDTASGSSAGSRTCELAPRSHRALPAARPCLLAPTPERRRRRRAPGHQHRPLPPFSDRSAAATRLPYYFSSGQGGDADEHHSITRVACFFQLWERGGLHHSRLPPASTSPPELPSSA